MTDEFSEQQLRSYLQKATGELAFGFTIKDLETVLQGIQQTSGTEISKNKIFIYGMLFQSFLDLEKMKIQEQREHEHGL